MGVRCGGCLWEPVPTDDDVSGHSSAAMRSTLEIAYADDPKGGHLVRIRFDNPEEEKALLAVLERDRLADDSEGHGVSRGY